MSLFAMPGHISPQSRLVVALGFIVNCDQETVALPCVKVDELLVLARSCLYFNLARLQWWI